MVSLSFLLMMFSIEAYLDFTQSKKRFIGFYAFDNSPISFVNGLEADVFVNDTVFHSYQKKVIASHLYSEGVRRINWKNQLTSLQFTETTKIGRFNGSAILSAMNWNIILPIEDNLQVLELSNKWICVFTDGNSINLQFIKTTPAKVIFDNTIKKWSDTYNQFSDNKAVHFISWQGYFQLDIN